MGIKIPGWLVSLLTFPGVILHEWAHKKFCDLAKVKVHEVVYFNLDFIGENEPAGYVIHERPTTYKQIFLISVGPLIINSLATILLGYLFQILGFNTPETQNSLLAIILAWLALSVGMHAFPSDEDMKHILEASKIELAKGGSKLHYLAFPFVWLISLANKLRAIWFDVFYAGLLMMLGISLASLNISLILFVLLGVVILSFVFLFFIQSNLQSSIVKAGIILIVLLNLFYLLRTTDWYKDKVIEFKAKRFIAEVRKEMKEKSSKGLSTYGVVDDVYERMLKSDPDAKKIMVKADEILKKEKTQKINKIKKTYKKDFLKAVELALKEKGYSNLYQFFAKYYENHLSRNKYGKQIREPILEYAVRHSSDLIGNTAIFIDDLKFFKLFSDKRDKFFEYVGGINMEELKNFSPTDKNILVYLTAYYLGVEEAIKNEDLGILSQAGFAINSKKSFVNQLTSKIKRGIDIIENIDLNHKSELEIKIMSKIENLLRKGIFISSDVESIYKLWYPLLVYSIANHQGKIPSWQHIARWQIEYVDTQIDAMSKAKKYIMELANMGITWTIDDYLNFYYASNFYRLYNGSLQGEPKILLPDLTLNDIKDDRSRFLTQDWIQRVYLGFKITKTEPPLPIKILYSRLTGEPIEDTYQNNAEPTEDTYEGDYYEEDQEPEVYIIETPFLKK
jgi:hypothetical protein